MNKLVKEFIESYIDLLEEKSEFFFKLAIRELDYKACEELIHVLTQAGVDTPNEIDNFLMKAALQDEIKYRPGIPSEEGKWARWLCDGYNVTNNYADWANAANDDCCSYQVYWAPYGWEGIDCDDYLILHRRIPLSRFIEAENMAIYDQTGEHGPFDIKDFKLIDYIV